MKEIIINNDNLREEDMTELVQRVKIMLINSKDEILLGYSHNNYQFPGGHVEEGEDLINTVNREIQEETGMELHLTESDAKPFAKNIGYYKDWPEVGKNRKIEIYYYEVKCDEKPNLDNTNYTDNEKDGGFKLEYIPLDNIEKVLEDNANTYGDKHGIAKEMLELLKYYKEEYRNSNFDKVR